MRFKHNISAYMNGKKTHTELSLSIWSHFLCALQMFCFVSYTMLVSLDANQFEHIRFKGVVKF